MADRKVCSVISCIALLKEMRRVQPPPEWVPSPHVFVVGADQTYKWQGCRKDANFRNKARASAQPIRSGR